MFIVNVKYKADLSVVDKFLVEHRNWLDGLYADGQLLCSGPQNPRSGGIIIALVKDLPTLKLLMATDPFAINGVAEYTFTEFEPVKFHPALNTVI